MKRDVGWQRVAWPAQRRRCSAPAAPGASGRRSGPRCSGSCSASGPGTSRRSAPSGVPSPVLPLGALDQPGLRQAGEQPGAGVVLVEQVGAAVVEQVVAQQEQPDLEERARLGLFAIFTRVAGRASAATFDRTDDRSSSSICSPAPAVVDAASVGPPALEVLRPRAAPRVPAGRGPQPATAPDGLGHAPPPPPRVVPPANCAETASQRRAVMESHVTSHEPPGSTGTRRPRSASASWSRARGGASAGRGTRWSSGSSRSCVRSRRGYRLNESDVEDVGQTVWLRLVENLDRIREPRALPAVADHDHGRQRVPAAAAHRRAGRSSSTRSTSPCRTSSRTHGRRARRRPPARRAGPGPARGLAELPAAQRRLLSCSPASSRSATARSARILAIPVGSIGPTRARGLARLRRCPWCASTCSPTATAPCSTLTRPDRAAATARTPPCPAGHAGQLRAVPEQHAVQLLRSIQSMPERRVDLGPEVDGEEPVALQPPGRHQQEDPERGVAEPEARRRLSPRATRPRCRSRRPIRRARRAGAASPDRRSAPESAGCAAGAGRPGSRCSAAPPAAGCARCRPRPGR